MLTLSMKVITLTGEMLVKEDDNQTKTVIQINLATPEENLCFFRIIKTAQLIFNNYDRLTELTCEVLLPLTRHELIKKNV